MEKNENVILKLGHDIIYKKIQASLLLLVNNKIELESSYKTIDDYEIPTDLKSIEHFLSKTLVELDKTSLLNDDVKLNFLDELILKKRELEDIFKSIKLYFYESENISAILKYYSIKSNANKEIKELEFISNADNEAIIDQCLSFIETDEKKAPILKSIVLSCFPLYLTKEKYADFFIENITKGFDEKNIDLFYQMSTNLKKQFSPTKIDDYGKYFIQIKFKLDNILSNINENLENEQIETLHEEIAKVKNDLDEINYYIEILLECFDYFIIVINFTHDIREFFIDKPMYSDMYYTIAENANNDELQFYNDTVRENLQDACEKLLDDILKDEKQFELLIKKFNKKSESLLELEHINKTITFFFYEEIDNIIYTIYKEDTENLNIDEVREDFIEYLKSSLSHLANKMQKILRQNFFTLAPCDYTLKDIQQYMSNALKNTTSHVEKAIIIYELNEVFDHYNFKTKHEHIHTDSCNHKEHIHTNTCNHH